MSAGTYNRTIIGTEAYQLTFAGLWNASTNSPALATGVGTTGRLYRVSVAGSTTLDGESVWAVDDDLFFDGTAWVKVDNNVTLAAVLANGNTSDGTDIEVSAGDRLIVDGSHTFRASALGVATGTDLAPVQVIANPNTGVSSQIVFFKVKLLAFATGGPVDTACWDIEGVIVREVGTDTVLFPTPPVITPIYNPNGVDWDVLPVADDPGKALKFTVTVDGFGIGPGTAPSASFFAQIELTPAGTPL